MDTHSLDPSPLATPECLPASWPPCVPIPSLEPAPGPEVPVRIADVPPNTPTPGTAADT